MVEIHFFIRVLIAVFVALIMAPVMDAEHVVVFIGAFGYQLFDGIHGPNNVRVLLLAYQQRHGWLSVYP